MSSYAQMFRDKLNEKNTQVVIDPKFKGSKDKEENKQGQGVNFSLLSDWDNSKEKNEDKNSNIYVIDNKANVIKSNFDLNNKAPQNFSQQEKQIIVHPKIQMSQLNSNSYNNNNNININNAITSPNAQGNFSLLNKFSSPVQLNNNTNINTNIQNTNNKYSIIEEKEEYEEYKDKLNKSNAQGVIEGNREFINMRENISSLRANDTLQVNPENYNNVSVQYVKTEGNNKESERKNTEQRESNKQKKQQNILNSEEDQLHCSFNDSLNITQQQMEDLNNEMNILYKDHIDNFKKNKKKIDNPYYYNKNTSDKTDKGVITKKQKMEELINLQKEIIKNTKHIEPSQLKKANNPIYTQNIKAMHPQILNQQVMPIYNNIQMQSYPMMQNPNNYNYNYNYNSNISPMYNGQMNMMVPMNSQMYPQYQNIQPVQNMQNDIVNANQNLNPNTNVKINNNPQIKPKRIVPFKPKTVKEYKEKYENKNNILYSINKLPAGLGPNIGTKDWEEKHKRALKMKEYSKEIEKFKNQDTKGKEPLHYNTSNKEIKDEKITKEMNDMLNDSLNEIEEPNEHIKEEKENKKKNQKVNSQHKLNYNKPKSLHSLPTNNNTKSQPQSREKIQNLQQKRKKKVYTSLKPNTTLKLPPIPQSGKTNKPPKQSSEEDEMTKMFMNMDPNDKKEKINTELDNLLMNHRIYQSRIQKIKQSLYK